VPEEGVVRCQHHEPEIVCVDCAPSEEPPTVPELIAQIRALYLNPEEKFE
jgi:hypothetical protein